MMTSLPNCAAAWLIHWLWRNQPCLNRNCRVWLCIIAAKYVMSMMSTDQHVLIIATDRLSAFDVVLPTAIPGKGQVLTALSNFWFARSRALVPNHLQLAKKTLSQALPDPAEQTAVADRAIVARKLKALPVEAIVRGYLTGSGWRDYQTNGKVCNIALPADLQLAERLPEPI